MKKSLVSILMPNYNQGQFFDVSIQSVLNQTYSTIELVVLDDQSTDNSRAILTEYQSKYPEKIRLIFPEERLGVLQSAVQLFEASRGTHIAWLSADNALKPLFVETLVAVLESGYDFAYAQQEVWSEDFSLPVGISQKTQFPFHFEAMFCGALREWEMFAFSTAYMFRRTILSVISSFNLVLTDEAIFAAECVKQGFRIKGVKVPLVRYREHATRNIDNHTVENWQRHAALTYQCLSSNRLWLMDQIDTMTEPQLADLFQGYPLLSDQERLRFRLFLYFRMFRLDHVRTLFAQLDPKPEPPKLAGEVSEEMLAMTYLCCESDPKLGHLDKWYSLSMLLVRLLDWIYPEKKLQVVLLIARYLSDFEIHNPGACLDIPLFIDYINQAHLNGSLRYNLPENLDVLPIVNPHFMRFLSGAATAASLPWCEQLKSRLNLTHQYTLT